MNFNLEANDGNGYERWRSTDDAGRFTIQRFVYRQRGGARSRDVVRCKAYYRVYDDHSNAGEATSFEDARSIVLERI